MNEYQKVWQKKHTTCNRSISISTMWMLHTVKFTSGKQFRKLVSQLEENNFTEVHFVKCNYIFFLLRCLILTFHTNVPTDSVHCVVHSIIWDLLHKVYSIIWETRCVKLTCCTCIEPWIKLNRTSELKLCYFGYEFSIRSTRSENACWLNLFSCICSCLTGQRWMVLLKTACWLSTDWQTVSPANSKDCLYCLLGSWSNPSLNCCISSTFPTQVVSTYQYVLYEVPNMSVMPYRFDMTSLC